MSRRELRWRFFIVAVVTVATVFGVWKQVVARKLNTDPRAVAEAEDEVYEAVVWHVYVPNQKSGSATQLVFSSTLDAHLCPGVDMKTCLDGVRQRLKGAADGGIRPDTIDDFIKRSQASGALSNTFRTDLP